MRAACITVHDPFRPAVRQVRFLRRPARVRSLAPRTNAPHIALLNGRPLLRAGWRRKLRGGDVLMFVVLPRGGGAAGASNPMRSLLLIAVLAFAFIVPALPVFAGLAGTTLIGSFTVGQAATLAISLAGSALVNALLPPPKAGNAGASASPTYSLNAQGNLARLEEAVPVQYGRLKVFPDFAAQPYVEYAGNEQYLYQLLCLGLGEYDIEEIRIEDTPISSFTEIEQEIVAPGGTVTLFPTAVATSGEVAGQTFPGAITGATYSQTGTTLTVTSTAHGLVPGQAVYLAIQTGTAASDTYAIATVPTADTFTVTVPTGTASGNVNVHTVLGGVGGFSANAPGTLATRIGIDVLLPRGLYYQGESGGIFTYNVSFRVEAMLVDDFDTPLGSWTLLGAETIQRRTTTPLRLSFRYAVAAGRYRVRARRTTVEQTSASYGNELVWTGLRAYLRGTQTFPDVTVIALRMRASNNLSAQAARRVNVTCTRKLPIWNGSSWSSPVATRSIAWALADAARNTAYGAGLSDAEIDLSALLSLDALWTARGDEFNGRFDAGESWWEAVTKIAGAGRARPFLQGGVLRVVRDGPPGVPVALYSMRNIVRGSFAVDYVLPSDDTADAVEVTYFDRTVWAQRRVTAALPGSSAAKPARIAPFGITDRAHALREGLYQAGSNRYRRRVVRFDTEMEGFIPSPGDAIAIQHDMPGWGQQAEAVSWDAATRTLTVSEPFAWGAGSNYVGLRAKDGSLDGPYAVTATADPYALVIASTPVVIPYTGSEWERTHVVFGQASTWRAVAKVLRVTPRTGSQVQIEAIIDDPSVHTAETGQTAAPIVISQLPSRYTAPVVSGLVVRLKPDDSSKVVLSWNPAPGADLYQIEMAEGIDTADPDAEWTRAGDTTASHFVVDALYAAQTMIRVRAVGLAAGTWSYRILGSSVPYMWGLSSASMWTSDSNLMWT